MEPPGVLHRTHAVRVGGADQRGHRPDRGGLGRQPIPESVFVTEQGKPRHQNQALVISHGLVNLYRRYFDDAERGRLAWDPHHHSMHDLQGMLSEYPNRLSSIPLFLTERGTPMSSNLFRDYYWRPALRASGIHAHPHQARHWFVTNALRTIETTATGEQDQRRRKEELIRYMKWRSGEKMLHAYEHVDRETLFITKTLPAIHAEMKRLEQRAGVNGPRVTETQDAITPTSVPSIDSDLALLTGE